MLLLFNVVIISLRRAGDGVNTASKILLFFEIAKKWRQVAQQNFVFLVM